MKRRALAAALIFALLPMAAEAATYPPDPISPTDASECHQLYAQYQALHGQLSAEAKNAGDAAWAAVRSRNGPSAESSRLYGRASALHDEAFEVLMAGSRARTRCMAAVNAHKRNDYILAETQRTVDDLPDRAGRSVRDGMLSGSLSLLEKFGSRSSFGGVTRRGPLGPEGRLALGGLRNALRAFGGLEGLYGRSAGSGGALGFSGNGALMGYGRAAGWSVLQRRLVRTALETVLDLHRSALADLDRALTEFDEPPGQSLESRLSAMSRKTSVEVMGGYRGGGASRVAPEGDIAGAYDAAREEARRQVAARSDSSRRAIAAAAAERERERAAARERERAAARARERQQSRQRAPVQSRPAQQPAIASRSVRTPDGRVAQCNPSGAVYIHDHQYAVYGLQGSLMQCLLAQPLGSCPAGMIVAYDLTGSMRCTR